MLYIWYPKNRTDLNTIHEQNDVIEMGELARVKAQLKRSMHTCLIRGWNTQELRKFVEFYDRTVIRLLSRDHRTPINSYKSHSDVCCDMLSMYDITSGKSTWILDMRNSVLCNTT